MDKFAPTARQVAWAMNVVGPTPLLIPPSLSKLGFQGEIVCTLENALTTFQQAVLISLIIKAAQQDSENLYNDPDQAEYLHRVSVGVDYAQEKISKEAEQLLLPVDIDGMTLHTTDVCPILSGRYARVKIKTPAGDAILETSLYEKLQWDRSLTTHPIYSYKEIPAPEEFIDAEA